MMLKCESERWPMFRVRISVVADVVRILISVVADDAGARVRDVANDVGLRVRAVRVCDDVRQHTLAGLTCLEKRMLVSFALAGGVSSIGGFCNISPLLLNTFPSTC